jgi:hypothetical protein
LAFGKKHSWEMKAMKSTCCFEDLEIRNSTELYHGADDDYELIVPFLVCTKCGAINLHYVEENKEQTVAS